MNLINVLATFIFFILVMCVLFVTQVMAQGPAPWQPSERFETFYGRYAVSDSSVSLLPVKDNPDFYKVYDFSTKHVYVISLSAEHILSHKFSDIPAEEVDFVRKQACEQVHPTSDFRRFCSLSR